MIQVKVTRLNCGGCAKPVTQAIPGMDPGAAVKADLKQGFVSVSTSIGISEARFVDAIQSAGYGAEPFSIAA